MKRLRNFAVLALLAIPLIGVNTARADDVDVEQLYQKVVKSCVFIVVPMDGGYAMGSGSLIDKEKKIVLTNYHVVDDKDLCFCQFPIYLKDGTLMTDKEKYKANIPAGLSIKGKVLYRDKSRDLAFVQLDKVPIGAPALPLAKKSIAQGATVWNIGSPGAVSQVFSITEGKVRAVGVQKFLVGGGGEVFEIRAKMVTTTNPSNQGDSGGPLFDKRGYQVAVTQSGNTKAQLVSNFVDVTEVRNFLNEKKLSIKELSEEPDAKAEVKIDPKDTKLTTPPIKDNGGTVTPPPKKESTVPVASEADEKAASELLRRSRLFKDGEDNRPTYIAKLSEIVKKYPTTTSAKEAKKILDGLK